MSKMYQIMFWIRNLAWLQVRFLLFSLVGLVILGFFPAVFMMFKVITDWFQGEHGMPSFKESCSVYKKKFLKSNCIGGGFLAIGYVLYIDYQYFLEIIKTYTMFKPIIFLIIYIFIGVIVFAIPTQIKFDLGILETMKYSFLYSVRYPFTTFILIFATLVYGLLLRYFPGLFPVLGISVGACLWVWGTSSVFENINAQKQTK